MNNSLNLSSAILQEKKRTF